MKIPPAVTTRGVIRLAVASGSRPARHALWEYVFYVDIEGHQNDKPVAIALAELARNAAYLKVLGSYPVAVY